MTHSNLLQAVQTLARDLADLPDSTLDRPWAWQSYDSEGVRFGLFRTFEDLRDLAARLSELRGGSLNPLSETQRILGQYHAAWRDLQAALLGVPGEQLARVPAEGEWPVSRALAHMLGADISFFVVVAFALEHYRGGGQAPVTTPEEAWPRIIGLDEAGFDALMSRPAEDLMAYFDTLHTRVLAAFAGISAEELDLLVRYWEDEPYPLRFRLHRFESHMRQHTIQVDKTLVALGQGPSESQRLLRLIYGALAEVESTLIGADDPAWADPLLAEAAQTIAARGAELVEIARK